MGVTVLKVHGEAREKVRAGLNILASAVKIKVNSARLAERSIDCKPDLTTDCIIVEAPKHAPQASEAIPGGM